MPISFDEEIPAGGMLPATAAYGKISFDEEPVVAEPVTHESVIKKISDYYTNDIPEVLGGILTRFDERLQNVLKPTVLGNKAVEAVGATGPVASAVNAVAGVPEVAGRMAGAAAGTVTDVAAGAPLELAGRVVNKVTGGTIDGMLKVFGDSISKSEPLRKAAEWWNGLSEAEKANYSSALDISTLLGFKAGGEIPKVIEGTGKITKDIGTKALSGELKIKDTLAQKGYGRRIDQKKLKILNDISKYDLESVTGNFTKMADKAEAAATQRVNDADAIISKIATSPNAPKEAFVDDILLDMEVNIDRYVPTGKERTALNILSQIEDGAILRGQDGIQGVEVLSKFKRELNDKKIFNKGPAPDPNSVEALETQIRKELYLKAVEKLRSISPEAYDLNRQAKELLDIASVAASATSRISNREMVSLTDRMINIAPWAGAAGGTALSGGDPSKVAMAVLGGLLASLTIKGLGQGRGASGIIKAGKRVSGVGAEIDRTGVSSYLGAALVSQAGVPDDQMR